MDVWNVSLQCFATTIRRNHVKVKVVPLSLYYNCNSSYGLISTPLLRDHAKLRPLQRQQKNNGRKEGKRYDEMIIIKRFSSKFAVHLWAANDVPTSILQREEKCPRKYWQKYFKTLFGELEEQYIHTKTHYA